MAHAARYISEDIRGIQIGNAASFAATPGAYTTYFAREISHETGYDMFDRNIQKTRNMQGPEPKLVGADSGGVNFKLMMRGGKTSAGAGSQSAFAALATNCGFTLVNHPADVGVVTAGDPTSITALKADFAAFNPGMMILTTADKGGSPDVQMRLITRKEDSAGTHWKLHVTPNWSTNPVAGDDVEAMDNLYPTVGEPTAYVGVDVYMGEGATNIHRVRYLGCAGIWKLLTTKTGEVPLVEFNYNVDNWAVSETALTQVVDSYAEPELMLADQLYLDNTQIDFESFGFDPGTELIPMPGQSVGADGRIGWFYKDHVPVIELVPYWDNEYYSLLTNATIRKLFYSNVLDVYQAWGIGVSGLQVSGHSPGAFAGGLVGSALEFTATDPGQTADSDWIIPWCIGISST